MLTEVWTNVSGSMDQCLGKCGLMIKEVWTNS